MPSNKLPQLPTNSLSAKIVQVSGYLELSTLKPCSQGDRDDIHMFNTLSALCAPGDAYNFFSL